MIYLIVKFKMKLGSIEVICEVVVFCLEVIWKEFGCICYDFYQNIEDLDLFVFVE